MQRFRSKVMLSVGSAIQTLLLRRYRVLQMAIVVIGALVSAALAGWILFTVSSAVSEIDTSVRLDTVVVDEMELLIELRQTALENPPFILGGVFGL